MGISSATSVDWYGIHVIVPYGMKQDSLLGLTKKWRMRSLPGQMLMLDRELSMRSTTSFRAMKQSPASITETPNGLTVRKES